MATATTKKAAAPKAEKAAVKAEKSAPIAHSTAFAVIMTGGKQYKVRTGETIKIEKMIGEFKVGDKITFNDVLMFDDAGSTTVGKPFIAGAKVTAELVEIGRDAKITVVHYKQKSKYFKKYGHRQPFFRVQIKTIA